MEKTERIGISAEFQDQSGSELHTNTEAHFHRHSQCVSCELASSLGLYSWYIGCLGQINIHAPADKYMSVMQGEICFVLCLTHLDT